MSNSVVKLDELFTAAELRSILKEYLCIESVLPCFLNSDLGCSAHCILPIKNGEEKLYKKTWVDHVLCRVLKKVPRSYLASDLQREGIKLNYI